MAKLDKLLEHLDRTTDNTQIFQPTDFTSSSSSPESISTDQQANRVHTIKEQLKVAQIELREARNEASKGRKERHQVQTALEDALSQLYILMHMHEHNLLRLGHVHGLMNRWQNFGVNVHTFAEELCVATKILDDVALFPTSERHLSSLKRQATICASISEELLEPYEDAERKRAAYFIRMSLACRGLGFESNGTVDFSTKPYPPTPAAVATYLVTHNSVTEAEERQFNMLGKCLSAARRSTTMPPISCNVKEEKYILWSRDHHGTFVALRKFTSMHTIPTSKPELFGAPIGEVLDEVEDEEEEEYESEG